MRLLRSLSALGFIWLLLRLVDAPIITHVPPNVIPYMDWIAGAFILFSPVTTAFTLGEIIFVMWGIVSGLESMYTYIKSSPERKLVREIEQKRREEMIKRIKEHNKVLEEKLKIVREELSRLESRRTS